MTAVDRMSIIRFVEPSAGAALLAVTLVDLFLTVLYVRADKSLISRPMAQAVLALFRWVAAASGRSRGVVMTYCGPVVLVCVFCAWAFLLTLGVALILHPALGDAVRSSSGSTPTDFLTALYAAGTSMSVVGASNISPHTDAFRLFYLFMSLAGMSALSLVVTYILQVYSALQSRNALARTVHLMTARTGDAAELVGRLGADGRLEAGYNNVASLASSLTELSEAMYLYPVLFYFRFPEPHYSTVRFILVLLDAAALIRSALDEKQARWLQVSASVEQLHLAALALARKIDETYFGEACTGRDEDATERAAWRARYDDALAVLARFGAPLRANLSQGAERYVELRAEWNTLVTDLGRKADLAPEELDPARILVARAQQR